MSRQLIRYSHAVELLHTRFARPAAAATAAAAEPPSRRAATGCSRCSGASPRACLRGCGRRPPAAAAPGWPTSRATERSAPRCHLRRCVRCSASRSRPLPSATALAPSGVRRRERWRRRFATAQRRAPPAPPSSAAPRSRSVVERGRASGGALLEPCLNCIVGRPQASLRPARLPARPRAAAALARPARGGAAGRIGAARRLPRGARRLGRRRRVGRHALQALRLRAGRPLLPPPLACRPRRRRPARRRRRGRPPPRLARGACTPRRHRGAVHASRDRPNLPKITPRSVWE